jgi:CHAT domain-containing protein
LAALAVLCTPAGGQRRQSSSETGASLVNEFNSARAGFESHFLAHRYKEALDCQERVLALCEKLHAKQDHSDLARSLHNMGAVLHALNDPRRALTYYQRALAMCQRLYPKQDHPDLAGCLNNTGRLLALLGDPRQSLPYLERGLAMCERLYPKQDHPQLAESLSLVGVQLVALGEARQALPYLHRSLAVYERAYAKDDHPVLAANLCVVSGVLADLGKLHEALPYCQRGLAMCERLYPNQDHSAIVMSLNTLASLLYGLGELHQALSYSERGLAMCERVYPQQDHPFLEACLVQRSLNLYALNQPRRALPYCQRALAMRRRRIEERASYASEAEALALATSPFFPRSRDLLLSLTLHIENSAAGAYAYAWDSKAAVTRVLERRHLAAYAAKDKKANDAWLALATTRRELAGVLLQPVRDEKARDKELNRLTERKEKLERDLAALLPELRQWQDQDRFGAEDLAKCLAADNAFLDFVRYIALDFNFDKPGKDGEKMIVSYAAFVLVKGRTVQRIELGPAQPIDDAVTAWRQAIAAWRADLDPRASKDLVAQANRRAAEMRRLVWDKLASTLPARTTTLYLSPDGDLARLPWAALPTGEADRVLLDDHLLAVVPHGPFLLARLMDKAPAPKTGDTLVVYGGVDYENSPDTLAKADPRVPRLGGDKRMEWPVLPGTDRERQAVAALAEQMLRDKPISRTGRAASTAQLLADLPQARYAHLATHGFFAEKQLIEERRRLMEQLKGWEYQSGQVTERVGVGVRSPLAYTGLVLAGANTPEKAHPDGGVTTGEALVDLPLEALRLCVLSACDTGLGDLTEAEGVQGLVRAFHLAGCPDVVASLWQVNDRATAALMVKFYHELWVNKRPPIEALREAQLLISRRPDLLGSLAGERGAVKLKEAVRVTSTEEPPKEVVGGGRLPPKLWAAFLFFGQGCRRVQEKAAELE